MAQIKLKANPSQTEWNDGLTELSITLNASNIAALKAAIAAYEEETKLPETMRDCREFLRRMQSNNKAWYVDFDGSAEWKTGSITDWRVYPAKWQAEKLHALACMEQVWVAIHNGDFEWVNQQDSFCFVTREQKEVFIDQIGRGFDRSFFPFRTKELAEQARRILTDDLIKCAFRVK